MTLVEGLLSLWGNVEIFGVRSCGPVKAWEFILSRYALYPLFHPVAIAYEGLSKGGDWRKQ